MRNMVKYGLTKRDLEVAREHLNADHFLPRDARWGYAMAQLAWRYRARKVLNGVERNHD